MKRMTKFRIALLAFCLLIALVRRIRRKAMEDDALD